LIDNQTKQTVTSGIPLAAEVYAKRLAERTAKVAQYKRTERIISYSRGAVFFAGILLLLELTKTGGAAYLWLLPLVLLFLALMFLHERAIRLRRRYQTAVDFYENGVARLEERWIGSGKTGLHFLDEKHPYAGDLDLFGRGSLYELLCCAKTSAGEKMLADWLLSPASRPVIQQRQAAVAELGPLLDFREDLYLTSSEVKEEIRLETLIEWGDEKPVAFSSSIRVLSAALVCFSLLTLAGWGFKILSSSYFLLALLFQTVFAFVIREKVNHAVEGVETAGSNLRTFAKILTLIETGNFEADRLCELKKALLSDDQLPSIRIRILGRLVDLLESRRNTFFFPLASLLLWKTNLAFAVDAWRLRTGAAIRRWVDAAAEMECLASFAILHYERPENTFPEIVETVPCFEAESAGHPLLPAETCVRNDVALNDQQRLLVVSGSNMSGKSTLLRTVGINTVLALAGAPVRARKLRVSEMRIGASILIRDSLVAGISHFYAEILRLRQILELTTDTNRVLFLLDEILHGTNSKDRLAGSEAYVRGLLQRGAIGIITTHDLALAKIAEELAPLATNIHFVDHIEDGRMVFDYRIYPGVVKKSNALDLMRSVGLDV
jgi:hypothetical protein